MTSESVLIALYCSNTRGQRARRKLETQTVREEEDERERVCVCGQWNMKLKFYMGTDKRIFTHVYYDL